VVLQAELNTAGLHHRILPFAENGSLARAVEQVAGRVIGAAAIIRDITVWKRAESGQADECPSCGSTSQSGASGQPPSDPLLRVARYTSK
jgi:hypothetical protein